LGPRAVLDDVEKRKFLILPGLELRPLGRPARSQSLYLLRYPGYYSEPPFLFNLFGGSLGTAATSGLMYQPRMIGEGDYGEIGGIKIGRGSRSTPRKPAQRHFVHHKSNMTRPGFEPGPSRWEASD
jgi:hypothetical protein